MFKKIFAGAVLCVLLLTGCSVGRDRTSNTTTAPAVSDSNQNQGQDKSAPKDKSATQDKSSQQQKPPATTNFGNSKSTPALAALAAKQKETLDDLAGIVQVINEAYAGWQNGNITRQEFSDKCLELLPQANKLNNDLKSYQDANQLSGEDLQNPLYDGGLKYGKDLTLYVCGFISESIKGNKNVPVESWANSTPNTDDRVRSLYDSLIVKSYGAQRANVEEAVNRSLTGN